MLFLYKLFYLCPQNYIFFPTRATNNSIFLFRTANLRVNQDKFGAECLEKRVFLDTFAADNSVFGIS